MRFRNVWAGRWNRAAYWLGAAILILFFTASYLLGHQVRVSEVLLLLLAVPRLHDIGRSGWWALVGAGIEAVGVAAILALGPEIGVIISGICFLMIVGLLIWLGCIRGDPGDNRFGSPEEWFKRKGTADSAV